LGKAILNAFLSLVIAFITLKPAKDTLFNIRTEAAFRDAALSVFRYQAAANPVYKRFLQTLGVEGSAINSLEQIPFLPVEFFKDFEILTGPADTNTIVFSSSGTTGSGTSRHPVSDITLYENSFRKGFELFYGDIRDYAIFALLPSYQEREGSSLIYMVNDLIKRSGAPESRFYLNEEKELVNALKARQAFLNQEGNEKKKSLLIGVTYALLDLSEKYSLDLQHTIVMETGGMKGKRKEIVREELHEILCKRLGVHSIHSEYGMTELLSQAYSKGNGIFKCPPWMNVFIRDVNDPFTFLQDNKTGGINIIDLANLNSCSFIATQDLGKKHSDGSFEVLGRFDNSDIRGCNLLVQ
jgi:hypothetical protein